MTTKAGKEMAVTVRRENLPAPVNTVAEIQQIGEMFERSGMFGCSQQGQGTVLAMTCVMQRMTPLEFIQTYHIVEGRPTMRADAMLANLLDLGGEYQVIERTADRAAIAASFRGAVFESCFTWEEAQLEPYIYGKDGKTPKKNWATPRARMQMLWARVVSDVVRVVCPLANRGVYTPEEIESGSDHGDEGTRRSEPKERAVDGGKRQTAAPTPGAVIDVEVVPDRAGNKDEKVQVPEPGDGLPAVHSVMPIGKMKGTAFSKMTTKALEYVLQDKDHPEITESHKDEVRRILEARKDGAAS